MLTQRLSLFALALLLGSTACTMVDQRNAIELRGIQAQFDDDSTGGAIEEPVGLGVAILGMIDPDAYLPVAYEIGVARMDDEGDLAGINQNLQQDVAWVGMRAELFSGHWRPHLGVGLIFVDSTIERTFGTVSSTDELSSGGAYLELGSRLRLSNRFHLGLGLRQTYLLEDDLGSDVVDLDFLEGYATLGFTF